MKAEKNIQTRIGSDIMFSVKILGARDARKVGVQSVEAYFINKDLQEKYHNEYVARKEAQKKREEEKKQREEDFRKHFKFLRRYPVTPLVNDFRSTICCLNNPCHYGYNTLPIQAYYHVYDGFGVVPFKEHHDHHHKPIKDESIVRGDIYYTEDRSTIEVYFPATRQKHIGTYDLILNVKVADRNFSYENIREFTIDYSEFIKLTPHSEQYPSGITDIVIGEDLITDKNVDVHLQSGELTNGCLELDLSNGGIVHVDVSQATNWEGETPEDLPHDKEGEDVKFVPRDIYTKSGVLNDNCLELNLSNDDMVHIDMSNLTDWEDE